MKSLREYTHTHTHTHTGNLKNIKEQQNQKGITLIVLVITIIILLILSGITIGTLTGENGLFARAKEAKEKASYSQAEEKVRLAVNASYDNNASLNKEMLKENLNKIDGINPKVEKVEFNLKVTVDRYEFIITEIGQVTTVDEQEELPENTPTTEAGTKVKNKEKWDNKTIYGISDGEGNTIPVPYGFFYVGGNFRTGVIISDNEADKYDRKTDKTTHEYSTELKGNQYVWIPCTTDSNDKTKLQYKRTEWEIEDDNNTLSKKDELTLTESDVIYSEDDIQNGINESLSKEIVHQISNEKISVEKYEGYYIGRYEIGKTNSNTAVIKANQELYTSIEWINAYNLAKGINTKNSVTTYLCSSYAWDTAINFIQNNTKWTNYGSSRENTADNQNTNENWKDRDVLDKNGTIIKEAGITKKLNTGLTSQKAHIYDMGGNIAEFTTEILPGTTETIILRGGSCYYDFSAGYRWDGANKNNEYKGFRTTLFLN